MKLVHLYRRDDRELWFIWPILAVHNYKDAEVVAVEW